MFRAHKPSRSHRPHRRHFPLGFEKLEDRTVPTWGPVGNEFIVDPDGASAKSVAVNGAGNGFVTWTDQSTITVLVSTWITVNGERVEVYHTETQQVTNTNGSPLDSSTGRPVNVRSDVVPGQATVAGTASGKFIVLSNDFGNLTGTICNADGSYSSGFSVATSARYQSVAADAQGNFVVAYLKGQADVNSICIRRFNASGVALGPETILSAPTGNPNSSSVAMDANGRFVIVYDCNSQDGDGLGIYAVMFDASGAQVGSEFRVNTTTTGNQTRPSVAYNAQGEFAVVWQSSQSQVDGSDIYLQRYDGNGAPIGVETRLNSWVADDQTNPTLGYDAAGDLIVAWSSQNQDGDGTGVFVRMFDSAMNPVSQEIQFSSNFVGSQSNPEIAVGSSGLTWLTWNESGGIRGRLFGFAGPNTAPVASAGGPYVVPVGSALTLNGAGSIDADPFQNSLLTYAWDLNGDGIIDSHQKSINLSISDLQNLGLTLPDQSITVVLTVTDPTGAMDVDSTTIKLVAGSPPVAVAGVSYAVAIGSPFIVSATGSFDADPGQTALLTYSWDINGDGVFGDDVGKTATLTYAELTTLGLTIAPGTSEIRVKVTDPSGLVTISEPVLLTIYPNLSPFAKAGGPYFINFNESLKLDASQSSDPDYGQTLTYSWDINGDGLFGDATGAKPVVTWAQLKALGLSLGITTSVRVMVTDNVGISATSDPTTLTINTNRAPIAYSGLPYTAIRGNSLQFDASGSKDLDLVQSLTYSWDVNNDGVFDDATGKTPTLTWSQLVALGINEAGSVFGVRVRVTDELGGQTVSNPTNLTVQASSPPGLSFNGAYIIAPGQTLTLSGTGSDADLNQSTKLQFAFDINNDGVFGDVASSGPSSTFNVSVSSATLASLGIVGEYQGLIAVRAIDPAGESTTRWVSFAQTSQPKILINPVVIDESLSVAPSLSFNRNFGGSAIAYYGVDINGDGSFSEFAFSDTLSSGSRTISTSLLAALGIKDGARIIPIQAQVTINGVTYLSNISTLTVLNTNPSVAISPPLAGQVVVGESNLFTFTATDPGITDQASLFTYAIDWNGDGNADETVVGASSITVGHVFETIGTFTIGVTAQDKDGGVSLAATSDITVGGSPLGLVASATTLATGTVDQLDIASDSLGNTVVVWRRTTSTNPDAVYAQVLSPLGTAVGAEFLVSNFNVHVQSSPKVAIAPDGTFLVVWQENTDHDQIFGRRFSASGSPLGSLLNISNDTSRDQQAPAIAATADGNYIVVWESDGQDGSSFSVMARLLDSSGNFLTNSFRVNSTTTGSQSAPQVAATPSGGFVVTWLDANGNDSIMSRGYNSSGLPFTEEQILTYGISTKDFAIDFGNSDRGIVAISSSSKVLWMMIDEFGQAISAVTPYPLSSSGNSIGVAVNDDGSFILSWEQSLQSKKQVLAQRFDSNLMVTGPAFVVSPGQAPTLSRASSEDFTVAYKTTGGFSFKRYGSTTNTAPVASVVMPTSISEGTSISLDASASYDPDPGQQLYFTWDINHDGIFGDVSGSNPLITWAMVKAYGLDEGPATLPIDVLATDNYGLSSTARTYLTLIDRPPTASITGPASALRGEQLVFTLSATDWSSVDQQAGFTFFIDWNNDGATDETITGPSGVTISHAFDNSGSYSIGISAMDKDGQTGSKSTLTQMVTDRALRPSLDSPGLVDFYWSGTSGNDSVSISQTASTQVTLLTTLLNGQVVSTNEVIEGVTGKIVLLGRKGNDVLNAELLSDKSVEIRGGAGSDTISGGASNDQIYGDGDGAEGGADVLNGNDGNDTIYGDGAEGFGDTISGGNGDDYIAGDTSGGEGGADVIQGNAGNDSVLSGGGNDYVDGGDGNDLVFDADDTEGAADTILGGDGRDVIIAGHGADEIHGGNGEDILIASFYTGSMNDAKLIMNEWTSSRSFADRVANISGSGGGSGANGTTFLVGGTTVKNDNTPAADIVDLILADDNPSEPDWIFADVSIDNLDETEVGIDQIMIVL